MKFAMALHLVSVTVWVGGMFFAYLALRPAAARLLEAPQRLSLWRGVFARFFPWVWVSVLLIAGSGLAMYFGPFGGFEHAPANIQAMFALGAAMVLIFVYVFFAPYPRLQRCVGAQDWPAAARALAQIRVLIGLNLSLGLINIVVATAGDALF